MKNVKFREYMDRLTDEIRNEGSRLDFIGRFVVAWTLLSRIPLPKKLWPSEMPTGNRTLPLAPLAGGLLGLLVGIAVSVVRSLGLGAPGSIWIGVLFYSIIGWSLHLDGWGDLWDGVGSGRQGEELRSVMKDSRLGAYGAVGLILAFGLWTSLAGSVRPDRLTTALIVSAASGRFACCTAAYMGRYPWESGMGKGWVDTFTGYDLFISLIAFFVFMPIAPVRWFLSAAAALITGFGMADWMNSRLGGVNGDVLGAAAVAAEIASLAVFSA